MDATGLTRTTVSDYFCSHRFRRWVMVSTVIMCGSLLALVLVVVVDSIRRTPARMLRMR
jgi:hypothetical protein